MMEPTAAASNAIEVGAIRAAMLISGANEIARINRVKEKELCKARISNALNAIRNQLGRNVPELAARDPKVLELLEIATAEVYRIRIHSTAHLFSHLSEKIPRSGDVTKHKKVDRDKLEALVRRVAKGLTNGHAGAWI